MNHLEEMILLINSINADPSLSQLTLSLNTIFSYGKEYGD